MVAPLTVGDLTDDHIPDYICSPDRRTRRTSKLTIDQRSFALTGLGLDPPLPTASIQLGMQTGVSAQQSTVSIPLATPSKISGTGTLTMDFHPNVTGVTNDPPFSSSPGRSA